MGGATVTYEISYIDDAGERQRRPLRDVQGLPFHTVAPVREMPAYRSQKHLSGFYWLSTTRAHVPYESRLECDIVMLLDFAGVEAIAAQPFCLHARAGARGRPIEHTPDYFALVAGKETVIDVTRAEKRYEPASRAQGFAMTEKACAEAGWGYRIETEPEPLLLSSVRALAGFRREPADLDLFGPALLSACVDPKTIGALSKDLGLPALVRPVLFHLLWKRRLVADLRRPLSDTTLIGTQGDDEL